ncbi:MAG: aminotransferase class I/II-fold pyridoxal phosphate-dependent enzyme [Vicinamibacterales bacterium]
MALAVAPYMTWAKRRTHATYDLANSNLFPCALGDLPGALDGLELNGHNDEGYPPLVEAIAARYGVDSSRVATATGASAANFLACAAVLEAGDEVLVERPGYDPLMAAPRMLGARVNRFDRRWEDGFALDPSAVGAAMTPATRLIILTNLHNPSGVLASSESLIEIGRIAERARARVLVDEVYLDALLDGAVPSAASLGETFISTSSLTKSYGLAGIRCGWALASPEVAERIRRARDVVDGSGAYPAEQLSAYAFGRLDKLADRARRILVPNLAAMTGFLDSRPEFEYVRPSGGTVVFPRFRDGRDAAALADRLFADYDTAIVPGRFFDAPSHLRLSFGGPADRLAAGLERLARCLTTRPGRGGR